MKAQPAKFREMQLDTHKTLPPEVHPSPRSPSASAQPKTQQLGPPAATGGSRAGGAGKPKGHLQQQALQRAGDVCKSTFRAKPENAHVIALANEHKALVEGSGWALLNNLDSALERTEAQQRLKVKHDMQGASKVACAGSKVRPPSVSG
jgi:hypothetical protein